MSDREPNYAIERRRLELRLEEHIDTIERGKSRRAEIARAKKRNTSNAELANLELDAEDARVLENEQALRKQMAEIEVNLKAMVKTGDSNG